jgi:hypothetical protein
MMRVRRYATEWLIVLGIICRSSAMADWTTPTDISLPSENISDLAIAVDSGGNTTAVWSRFNGSNLIVQSSTKPYGGVWQAEPDDLSQSGRNASAPQIAVHSNGDATVVWRWVNETASTIQASTRLYGDAWQAIPDTLSQPGNDVWGPQIAIDVNGSATVVWNQFNGIIQSSSKSYRDTWQAVPNNLFQSDQQAYDPRIAFDPSGDATVVWRWIDGDNQIIQAIAGLSGSTLQTVSNNSSQENLDGFPGNNNDVWDPQVIVDADGNATVVWNQSDGIIRSSTKSYGGTWQATPDGLSQSGYRAYDPHIAVDVSGNITVVWSLFNEGSSVIQASTKPYGGTWQTTPDTLSQSGQQAYDPRIAVDSSGNATVVWRLIDGTDAIIKASAKPYGGTWQTTPDTLSQSGQQAYDPRIAVDSSGNATVIWGRFNGNNLVIQSSTRTL